MVIGVTINYSRLMLSYNISNVAGGRAVASKQSSGSRRLINTKKLTFVRQSRNIFYKTKKYPQRCIVFINSVTVLVHAVSDPIREWQDQFICLLRWRISLSLIFHFYRQLKTPLISPRPRRIYYLSFKSDENLLPILCPTNSNSISWFENVISVNEPKANLTSENRKQYHGYVGPNI